jgi:hypothetical protein
MRTRRVLVNPDLASNRVGGEHEPLQNFHEGFYIAKDNDVWKSSQ